MIYVVYQFRKTGVLFHKFKREDGAWHQFQDYVHQTSGMECSTFMYQYDPKTGEYDLLHARERKRANNFKVVTLRETERQRAA